MLQITDNTGKTIEITDLDKAIEQADAFKDMQVSNPGYEVFNDTQRNYWTDVYNKLTNLKNADQNI